MTVLGCMTFASVAPDCTAFSQYFSRLDICMMISSVNFINDVGWPGAVTSPKPPKNRALEFLPPIGGTQASDKVSLNSQHFLQYFRHILANPPITTTDLLDKLLLPDLP